MRIQCPQCNYESGNDWSQCADRKEGCPMPGSPHFNPENEHVLEAKKRLNILWDNIRTNNSDVDFS